MIKKIKFKSFVFTLKADVEECIARDKTRNPLGEKNIKEVHALISKFDYGILVDTNKKSKEEIRDKRGDKNVLEIIDEIFNSNKTIEFIKK